MRVVLYGATGKAGSVILKELVDRGLSVTAVARTPEKVQKLKNVSVVQGDLNDPTKIAGIVKGADAVVSAYGPPPDKTTEIISATNALKRFEIPAFEVPDRVSVFARVLDELINRRERHAEVAPFVRDWLH